MYQSRFCSDFLFCNINIYKYSCIIRICINPNLFWSGEIDFSWPAWWFLSRPFSTIMRSVRAEFFNFHSELGTESARRSTRRLSESSRKASPRVEPLGSLATAMPSVGMRRTTRVFGVVKGVDGARVLRSGRRLWPDSGEIKIRRHGDSDDWFKIGKGDGGLNYDPHPWVPNTNSKPKRTPAVAEIEAAKHKDSARVNGVDLPHGRPRCDRMFGLVYSRKRKGLAARSSGNDSLANSETSDGSIGRKYERRFARRQRRKLNFGKTVTVANGSDSGSKSMRRKVVSIVFGSPMDRNVNTDRVVGSILLYLTRARLRLSHLFAFLLSEPIGRVYSSCGMNFLDHSSTERFATCKIFGALDFVPLFSVDFSAIPLCFMDMHSCMFFIYKRQPSNIRNIEIDEIISDDEEEQLSSSGKAVVKCTTMTSSEANHTEDRLGSNPFFKTSKLACRSTQHRNGLISRGIQKRRSSLRRRKARNPSLCSVQKPNGALVSDLVSFRRNSVSLSVAANYKIRRSCRSSSARSVKEVSSTRTGSTDGTDSTSCCANVLVIESDKCYREGGVSVELESSSVGEWLIAVKKDGATRFTHKAEKVMRPCSFNRVTHDIIWTADDGWKLEFPNRKDWLIFKDLYKECSDRNILIPGVKVIPIPGVNEVSQNGNNQCTLFCRPDSYISVKEDELCRAMMRKTAIYDMDSEDEECLKKFNDMFSAEDETHERISEDNFELMIDAFEKAFYCSPHDISDEKSPSDLCPHLGSSKVIEAIYGYWLKKRKQKRSLLIRVFQLNLGRRSFVPHHIRKKRSFKRQPSQQGGRGKQPSFLQAMAAERNTAEEQNAMHKVEEAKALANRSVELAVQRRQRAQLLMNNADLATYRATMALRIAEWALVCESSDAAAVTHLLLD